MLSASTLRVHHLEPSSQSNGPGSRAVLWLQGCTLNCPGCFNPHTHPHWGGKITPVDAIRARLESLADEIEGVTISGGEPLQQIQPLFHLLRQVRRRTNLSIILFTGYEISEIQVMPRADDLLKQVDILIAGRYKPEMKVASGMVGSANKNVLYLTDRYTPRDLAAVPEAEILVNPDGSILVTGIFPLEWM